MSFKRDFGYKSSLITGSVFRNSSNTWRLSRNFKPTTTYYYYWIEITK